MDTTPTYSIGPYHWLVAIVLAFILHLCVLLNFQQKPIGNNSIQPNKEIIIGLKKLKSPVQPKPVAEIVNPIDQPRPVEEKKPRKIVKQKISKPRLAPPMPRETPAPNAPESVQKQITPDSSQKAMDLPAKSGSDQKIRDKYLFELAAWLERHKRYPAVARRRGQEGKITIQFTMNADGVLLSHKILSPSVHSSLNTAVIKMLERASPMPPVPQKLRNGNTEFEYIIPVNGNHSSLG